MLVVVALWLVLGLVAGALANGAKLRPAAWGGERGWLWMLALGAGAALVGGILGSLVFGRLFSTPMALWISILAVGLGPRIIIWARSRRTAAS